MSMRSQEIFLQKKKAYHKPEMEVVVLGIREPLMDDDCETSQTAMCAFIVYSKKNE